MSWCWVSSAGVFSLHTAREGGAGREGGVEGGGVLQMRVLFSGGCFYIQEHCIVSQYFFFYFKLTLLFCEIMYSGESQERQENNIRQRSNASP